MQSTKLSNNGRFHPTNGSSSDPMAAEVLKCWSFTEVRSHYAQFSWVFSASKLSERTHHALLGCGKMTTLVCFSAENSQPASCKWGILSSVYDLWDSRLFGSQRLLLENTLMQRLRTNKTGCNDSADPIDNLQWGGFLTIINGIQIIKFPRCIVPDDEKQKGHEILARNRRESQCRSKYTVGYNRQL